MNKFLNVAKTLYLEHQIKRVVLGNPTADLDSCIGSVLLAYYYNFQTPTLPIINHNKEQFQTHFEMQGVFQELVFLEDIDLNKYEIVLYDHNDFQHQNIIGCVDHHEDKGHKFQFKQIEKVGSACTLVGEKLKEKNLITQEIAQLLVKVLLMDTFNFEQKLYQSRWNSRDYELFEYCLQVDKTIDRQFEYARLTNIMYDVNLNLGLPLETLMLKDYKEFTYNDKTQVGYSVFMVGLHTLLSKYSAEELKIKFDQLMESNNLDILVLLYLYQDQKHQVQRSVMLYGKNIAKEANEILKLKVAEQASFAPFFKDIDNVYSRKIIEPIIASLH